MSTLWEGMQRDFVLAMKTGNPPIYMQLLVLGAIFIVVKLYFYYKQKVRRARVPPPELVTNIFLLLVIIISLEGLNFALNIYRACARYIKTVIL